MEIQLFCYIINSQIIEFENCLQTWSIAIIIPYYDAIFSKFGGQWPIVLPFQLVKTGSWLV